MIHGTPPTLLVNTDEAQAFVYLNSDEEPYCEGMVTTKSRPLIFTDKNRGTSAYIKQLAKSYDPSRSLWSHLFEREALQGIENLFRETDAQCLFFGSNGEIIVDFTDLSDLSLDLLCEGYYFRSSDSEFNTNLRQYPTPTDPLTATIMKGTRGTILAHPPYYRSEAFLTSCPGYPLRASDLLTSEGIRKDAVLYHRYVDPYGDSQYISLDYKEVKMSRSSKVILDGAFCYNNFAGVITQNVARSRSIYHDFTQTCFFKNLDENGDLRGPIPKIARDTGILAYLNQPLPLEEEAFVCITHDGVLYGTSLQPNPKWVRSTTYMSDMFSGRETENYLGSEDKIVNHLISKRTLRGCLPPEAFGYRGLELPLFNPLLTNIPTILH